MHVLEADLICNSMYEVYNMWVTGVWISEWIALYPVIVCKAMVDGYTWLYVGTW